MHLIAFALIFILIAFFWSFLFYSIFKFLTIGLIGFIVIYTSYKIILNLPYIVNKIRFFLFLNSTKEVVGLPDVALEFWDIQDRNDNCAIATQSLVLKVFGVFKDDNDLLKRQQAYGSFIESKGSSSVTTLLDGYGISNKNIESKSLKFDLWRFLSQGKLVLAKVNSFLLSNHEDFNSYDLPIYDHVILITGISTINGKEFVFYSDTGVMDGSVKTIPFKYLELATSKYITVTDPIPNFKVKSKSFDLSILKKVIACSCTYV